jgi:hypothetical protein
MPRITMGWKRHQKDAWRIEAREADIAFDEFLP